MKPIVLGMMVLAVVVVSAFEEQASARSVSASTGRARLSEMNPCFDYRFDTGAVESGCETDFIVPLTTDHSGTKTLTFTSRASRTGAECRAVASDRFGTTMSSSPFQAIPVSDTFVSYTLAGVAVPSKGVFFADCITKYGTSLHEFDHAP